MRPETKRTIADIKSLRIQGARNVAKAAIKAMALELKHSKSGTPVRLLADLVTAGAAVCASRPTEPMMRNSVESLSRLGRRLMIEKRVAEPELRKALLRHAAEMLDRMDTDKANLSEYGARLIPDGALVMTHCHSSTATGILKRAKKIGKHFEVIACETRPRWQGRLTAAELADCGIKVSLVVDGGANMFMKKADMVIVGADAVTSRGDLINKVGTSMIAHIARMHDVSFYSAAELFKFSPMTIFGTREKIEERDPKEVWERPPKGVRIRNPAFDVTASGYLSGYVTEDGVIPAQSFFSLASRKIGLKAEGV